MGRRPMQLSTVKQLVDRPASSGTTPPQNSSAPNSTTRTRNLKNTICGELALPLKIEGFHKEGQDITTFRRAVNTRQAAFARNLPVFAQCASFRGQPGPPGSTNAVTGPGLRASTLGRQPTIDRQHLASDIGRRRAGQKQHGRPDFLGRAQPFGRNASFDLAQNRVPQAPVISVSMNPGATRSPSAFGPPIHGPRCGSCRSARPSTPNNWPAPGSPSDPIRWRC